jgi:hypothetical protein
MTPSLRELRKNVRRWSMLWRIMKKKRDRHGQEFAIERAQMWRRKINSLSH